jgi:hypothetical protein
MSSHRARIAVLACTLLAAAVLSPAGALAATNLIANPGFETNGSQTMMFTDPTLPNLLPYTVTSGGATGASGSITPTGAARTSDVVVVTGSDDYTDGTFQVQGTPVDVRTGLSGGIAFRYQDPSNFYGCTVTSTALLLVERAGGTTTVLKTATMGVTAGLPGYLKATAAGSALTCTAYSSSGSNIGSQIATLATTDSTLTSGQIGFYDANTTTTAGKMLTFQKPIMTATSPASWGALAVTAGRPGEIYDQAATPVSGTDSLQLYSGSSTFDGHVDQTGIAVTGSTPYTLTANISTANLTTAAQAQVVAVESPSGTSTILSNSLKNSAWTLNTFTFTTQASTTSVTIQLRLVGGGVAGFDDLSLSLAPVVKLALSTSAVDMGSISPLSSPVTLLNATTATVTANATWALTTQGSGAFSDGAGHTIPLSELAWRRSGTTTFTPFTTAAATVTTGAATTSTGVAVPLDYRLTVTYPDPASATPYSTSITYIATTP